MKYLVAFIFAVLSLSAFSQTTPIADAGLDTTLFAPSKYDLDASGSYDFQNEGLIFFWVQMGGPPVKIRREDQSEAKVRFEDPGEYVFTVVVSNQSGKVDTDDVIIRVK